MVLKHFSFLYFSNVFRVCVVVLVGYNICGVVAYYYMPFVFSRNEGVRLCRLIVKELLVGCYINLFYD